MNAYNRVILFVISLYFVSLRLMGSEIEIMDASALASFPNPAADHVIPYGEDKFQFGELRLPSGEGPHPVVVNIHGGCWLAEYDIQHSRKQVDALTKAGFATWNLEYRRVGNPGGGWTGTFDDVASGADHLVTLSEQYNLDLKRVLVSGHSAGGHLALWLANRPEQWAAKLQPVAVLALAPAADLDYLHDNGACQEAVDSLIGGGPEQYPERYKLGSATSRLPLDIPQYIVLGKYDTDWTPVGRRYVAAAKEQGNNPYVIEATESGHFEMIDPDSSTWSLVINAVKSALSIAD